MDHDHDHDARASGRVGAQGMCLWGRVEDTPIQYRTDRVTFSYCSSRQYDLTSHGHGHGHAPSFVSK